MLTPIILCTLNRYIGKEDLVESILKIGTKIATNIDTNLPLKSSTKYDKNLFMNWTKSTFCKSEFCVEISLKDGVVLIADSKNTAIDRTILETSPVVWNRFLDALIEGSGGAGLGKILANVNEDGAAQISDGVQTLSYTKHEWDDFIAGVVAGELKVDSED